MERKVNKITKEKLKTMIAEELENILKEQQANDVNEKFLALQQALNSDPPDIETAREYLSSLGALLQAAGQIT